MADKVKLVSNTRIYLDARKLLDTAYADYPSYTTEHGERLKQYEDTGLTPEEVESIVGATLTTNERRLKLGFQAANDDFCNHFILHYPQGGDSSG